MTTWSAGFCTVVLATVTVWTTALTAGFSLGFSLLSELDDDVVEVAELVEVEVGVDELLLDEALLTVVDEPVPVGGASVVVLAGAAAAVTVGVVV